MGLSEPVHDYVVTTGIREPELLRRLREETAHLPQHRMQVAPEQGAFLAMLVELTGATRCLEVGTFTGYSALCVARALPADGLLVCCDVSEEWTAVGRRYWAEAGIDDRIDLRIAPAVETLDAMIASGEQATYDFAFVDADKAGYDTYYDRLMELIRPGGLIAFDNVLWGGEVADDGATDTDTRALQALNRRLHDDERITLAMLPIADGVTLARKRP
jgi:predicted O-methyltransferase YrrM